MRIHAHTCWTCVQQHVIIENASFERIVDQSMKLKPLQSSDTFDVQKEQDTQIA